MRVAENIFDQESSDSYASACADLLLEVCKQRRNRFIHPFAAPYVVCDGVHSVLRQIWLTFPLSALRILASRAFAQIVDRLSSDDNGELLLQPIGHCKELVDGLAAMAVDESLSLERRTDSARTLLGITQKAADPNIVYVNARTVRTLTDATG